MRNICRNCGCTESQAIADARTLGLVEDLRKGAYTCCQIVTWADEQWMAWREAAEQDGRPADDATKPIEVENTENELVPVRLRSRKTPRLKKPDDIS